MKYSFYVAILVLWMSACTKDPKLEGLDIEQWKADRGACTGIRTKHIDLLKRQKESLRGATANALGEYLGKPDIHQLTDRNQKYYVYFLEAGTQCQDIKSASKSLTMAIRFSAMGMATEVTFQHGMP